MHGGGSQQKGQVLQRRWKGTWGLGSFIMLSQKGVYYFLCPFELPCLLRLSYTLLGQVRNFLFRALLSNLVTSIEIGNPWFRIEFQVKFNNLTYKIQFTLFKLNQVNFKIKIIHSSWSDNLITLYFFRVNYRTVQLYLWANC
jgi:hypothetical protein